MSEHYEVESLGHKDGNFEVKVGYFYEDIHPSDLFDNSLDPDTGKPYHDTDEMKEGDYEHLINTFDKYFGEYVILER